MITSHRKFHLGFIFMLAALVISGCSVIDAQQASQELSSAEKWIVLPMGNNAQQPNADDSAKAILTTLLANKGIKNLDSHDPDTKDSGLPDLNSNKKKKEALRWAREHGYKYGVSGVVSEWEYKTGLDGEPSVGMSLQVYDVQSGEIVWSASGSKTGWGYGSLSGTAQKLIGKLVSSMPIK